MNDLEELLSSILAIIISTILNVLLAAFVVGVPLIIVLITSAFEVSLRVYVAAIVGCVLFFTWLSVRSTIIILRS